MNSRTTSPQGTDAPLRVLVAEDHPAVRAGLVAALSAAEGIEVVGDAADGPATLAAARRLAPDVVLTDVRMPGATGIDITPRLRAGGAKVLVISAFDLDVAVLGALAAGADGFLVKTETPERIAAAVRAVGAGDTALSASAQRAVIDALRAREDAAAGRAGAGSGRSAPGAPASRTATPRALASRTATPGPSASGTSPSGASPSGTSPSGSTGPVPAFTRREEEVLALLADGLSNQEIASTLFVEVTTVKTHVTNVLAKTGTTSRVQAALWWHRQHGTA
ncbi:response regulator transcription factor [Brachybacterium nesterenkovii]|uniref:response regulator transcription factor n=1 Tax=Brachybacterium nesterenkovii TaxID=47847 RepID=UPI00321ADF81